jgi:hypothetical protein
VRFRALFLASLLIGAFSGIACDSGDDPKPASFFVQEEPAARSIFGVVVQGTEPVEGALVQVDADMSFASDAFLAATADAEAFPRTVATDPGGAFRVQFAPLHYDLSVRRDREVFVFREVAVRFFAPQLGADVPPKGFTARVAPTTVPAPAPGHAVAYFLSGYDSRTLTPNGPGSFEVTFRQFDTSIRIHAVEYDSSQGLAAAVSYGFADVRVIHGTAVSPVFQMAPLTSKSTVTFVAKAPDAFTLGPLDLEMDLTLRTTSQTVKRIMPGESVTITTVPFARYFVRGSATRDGSTSQSGRFMFDVSTDRVVVNVPLPDLVAAEAPADDLVIPASARDSLSPPVLVPNGTLAAYISAGVIEHTLTPTTGDGPSIHVATASRATTLPDVTRLGVPRPTGRYMWTMEHYPLLAHIDQLQGEDARVALPSWKSKPRVIELR